MPHVQPIFTELALPGLKTPFTVLQVTDLHTLAMTEEEAAAMPRDRYDYIQPRIGLFSEGRPYPPDVMFPTFADYAREIDADLVLLTGDIMDFPSDANIALLHDFIETSAVPVLYITGNHDWSYADDYHTPHAAEVHLPRIWGLSHTERCAVVYETEHIVFVAVDNSLNRIPAEAADVYTRAVTDAREKGKNVILAMHIPLRVDTLDEDCIRVWRQNLCIGEGAIAANDETSMAFVRAVTEGTTLAPDAVITGHLHLSHEDVYPNGVPQWVTDIACGGLCRVIRFLPAPENT